MAGDHEPDGAKRNAPLGGGLYPPSGCNPAVGLALVDQSDLLGTQALPRLYAASLEGLTAGGLVITIDVSGNIDSAVHAGHSFGHVSTQPGPGQLMSVAVQFVTEPSSTEILKSKASLEAPTTVRLLA